MTTPNIAHTAKINHRQQGAVLVISLLILLVLTLIGISSMDGSIMEEKMASNSQTATSTFQQAESSIRAAYYAERTNPAGAAGKNRTNNTTTDRSDAVSGITSASQHVYPSARATYQSNSSAGTFETRYFEVIGTANVDNIRSRNIQGYNVTNMMVDSP